MLRMSRGSNVKHVAVRADLTRSSHSCIHSGGISQVQSSAQFPQSDLKVLIA